MTDTLIFVGEFIAGLIAVVAVTVILAATIVFLFCGLMVLEEKHGRFMDRIVDWVDNFWERRIK
ncbi:MAG: hypothetical protein WC322_03280 [Candidatus Paceibacterota bacterium]|jgi:hypothetical protein